MRAEAVVRDYDGTVVGRGTIGIDRAFFLGAAGRMFSIGWEYQRDGLGAVAPEDLLRVFTSPQFGRGEFQVFGQDETMLNLAYEVTPLWTVSVFGLHSLNDGSTLLAPSVGYNAASNASVSASLYFGLGPDESTPTRPLASEYGLVSPLGIVMVSFFF